MSTEPQVYHILVRDLELPGRIGVHRHEKLAPQRLRINLDMAVQEQAGPLCDNIRNVLSYEDVIEGIKTLLAQGHVNLVETVAENIATLCLTDARVNSVRVRVEKPDVYVEAAAVGVEILRRRSGA